MIKYTRFNTNIETNLKVKDFSNIQFNSNNGSSKHYQKQTIHSDRLSRNSSHRKYSMHLEKTMKVHQNKRLKQYYYIIW